MNETVNLNDLLHQAEKDLLKAALSLSGGCITHAANQLGLNRTTLVEKVKRFGLRDFVASLKAPKDLDTIEKGIS